METTNLENDAKQVTFIADALRESVFQRLSYYKENCKSIHQKYSDSNWAGTAYRAHCGYYYKREFFYNPFCLESYQEGSDESITPPKSTTIGEACKEARNSVPC